MQSRHSFALSPLCEDTVHRQQETSIDTREDGGLKQVSTPACQLESFSIHLHSCLAKNDTLGKCVGLKGVCPSVCFYRLVLR